MPRISEKHPIQCPFLDRRTKLLPCQKEMVKYWSDKGVSAGKLSKIFNVSKRLIQFVIDPKKQEENLKRRREAGGSTQYYDRASHTKAQRLHRLRKDKIFHQQLPDEGKNIS